MDSIKQIVNVLSKYKYMAAVVLAGLALMLVPQKSATSAQERVDLPQAERSMEDQLEEILVKIQGVGKVQVLLTEAQGNRTVYVYDEQISGDSQKSDAVILTDGGRAQKGLISQVIPPVYLGAVVVCQGGDSPAVKLAVVEAICDATGLSADKISVLKMK